MSILVLDYEAETRKSSTREMLPQVHLSQSDSDKRGVRTLIVPLTDVTQALSVKDWNAGRVLTEQNCTLRNDIHGDIG